MKKVGYVIFLIMIGGITTGSAFALITHNEDVLIQGKLSVDNGDVVVNKTNGQPAVFTIAAQNHVTTLRLWDNDNDQRFTFRLPPDGSQFQFIRGTNTESKHMMIFSDQDRIGLLTNAPTKDVDINGDLKVRGTLYGHGGLVIDPQGDICIGKCP